MTMSLTNIFGIAATALNAQTVRLNVTASNLANAGTTASSESTAFKGKRPVFEALLAQEQTNAGAGQLGGVKIARIVDDKTPAQRVYDPGHPEADANGFLYRSNVSEVGEMVEMMAAARSFQNNVEVFNTARDLMLRTLDTLKT
jgi:flagellar basal-body rod protein FlgC